MIVLDTTVLVYAVGDEHALREPSRRLIEAIGEGRLRAATTPEVVQEFVHVRARRRARRDAVRLGRAYADLLEPLLVVDGGDLEQGLRLFERHAELGAFDAVLAAVAVGRRAEALVSADVSFGSVPGLRHVELGTSALDDLVPG